MSVSPPTPPGRPVEVDPTMTDRLAAAILADHGAGLHDDLERTNAHDHCPSPRCDEAWWHEQQRQERTDD